MYCRNCGQPITSIASECPYCHAKQDENPHVSKHKNLNQNKLDENMYKSIRHEINNSQNNSSLAGFISAIFIIVGFFIMMNAVFSFIDLGNSFFSIFEEDNKGSTYQSSSSYNKPTTSTYKPVFSSTKNYQQIYDEYSRKLINAGPTSSITEMAEICNEGVMKMAEYMYSAKGTDGQYATYESWSGKLYDVYINNCR